MSGGKESRQKSGEKIERREIESVEWKACTNRLISSLPLKAYPLLRIKNSFRHKPFKPIPSKWIISTAESSCEVTMLRKWFPPWLQPRNTTEHGKLIFSFFDFIAYCYCFFSCLCNFTYNAFIFVISFFFPILIKDILLALLNSNVFLLSLFLLHLFAITLLQQLHLPWACDQSFSKQSIVCAQAGSR